MDEQFKAFTFFTFEKRAVLIDGKWDARLFFNLYCDLFFFSAIRICNQKHIKTCPGDSTSPCLKVAVAATTNRQWKAPSCFIRLQTTDARLKF